MSRIRKAAAGMLSAKLSLSIPAATATPIKHLVVIYQENVSFDHYFGTRRPRTALVKSFNRPRGRRV